MIKINVLHDYREQRDINEGVLFKDQPEPKKPLRGGAAVAVPESEEELVMVKGA